MSQAQPQHASNGIPVRRAGLCCHELDGEALLYDPAHHAVNYLNGIAYLIWQQCSGEVSSGELPDRLRECISGEVTSEEFDVAILAALDHLVANGLVDWRRTHAA